MAHGREFTLIGREYVVQFQMAKKVGWKEGEDNLLKIRLTPELLAAFRASLQPVRGEYTWPELPGFTLKVQPSQITDSNGEVTDVIG